jgi:hypothetical protein
MIPWLAAAIFFTFICRSAADAASKSVTLYLDGARVEQELESAKGYLEMPLPPGFLPQSLRIKPRSGGEIVRVEVVPPTSATKPDKVRASLQERRERLEARLKVLDTREEIFKAAAKSQSGKAPKRSKNNPEPMETIRRGTDYALSQLEEVYFNRQRAEKELREVEKRLAGGANGKGSAGSVARIWLAGKHARIQASYLSNDLMWKPTYEFRITADKQVAFIQRAEIPPIEKGTHLSVVASDLSRADEPVMVRAAGDRPIVAEFHTPAEAVNISATPSSVIRFSFRNPTRKIFPSGEAACFWQGEFLGMVSFPGIKPEESREMHCGR